ncbi:LicD family protein [Catenovulum sp. 2E275]|uniref:tetratricopeptide repeat protein n=1 Tax=Catenovulum sp. 2E275 TaxID=2980497 RepID=UPI0021D33DE5|nr:LicD family protein [Catenovulum sp. 2E275]MCU4676765.1 LicD family protein [Catenovulum sp. 2E275]
MASLDLIIKGIKLYQQNQFSSAKTQFLAVLKTDPDSIIAIRYLTEIAIIEGTSAEYIEQIKQCLTKQPSSIDLSHLLAVVYQQNKQLKLAIQYYRKTLNLLLTTKPEPIKPTQAMPFDQKKYEATLWQTLVLFRQYNIRSFATSGTLLGLTRDNALLPFDKDIDIGIDWGQMSQAIKLLKQNGWQEHKRSYDLINPRCFIHSNGVILDLCGYGVEQKNGQTISGLWMANIPFSWNRVTTYSQIDLSDKTTPYGIVWHPKQPELILQALYGNWQVPDPDFDTIICAKNLAGFSLLTQCFAYSRIYILWRKQKWQKVEKLLAQVRHFQTDDDLFIELEQALKQQLTSP